MLDLSPGPIHAVDGDSGLNSPLSYAIVSGIIYTNVHQNVKCAVLLCVHLRLRSC